MTAQIFNKDGQKPAGPCALCMQNREYAKSHIISKFHSKKLYKNRKIVAFSEQCQIKTKPGGRWEYLLCIECDNRLGKESEDYAAKVLYYDPQNVAVATSIGAVYSNIDYFKFRTYLLFTLWRMSVSNLPYFQGVSLGNEHNESLRLALLNRDTLDSEFPVEISRVWIDDEKLHRGIVNPITLKDRDAKNIAVHLLSNGFLYSFRIKGYSPVLSYCGLGKSTISAANIYLDDIEWYRKSFQRLLDNNIDKIITLDGAD